MKTKRYILLSAVLACCAGSFAWYTSVSGTTNTENLTLTAEPVARPIPTTVVAEQSQQKVRLYPGTIKAKKSVNLAFSVDGLLVELNGREGSLIKKGDILAKIDKRDFQNSYEAAQANYRRAEADFKRTETLFKRSVISQSEYDTARTARDVALAEKNIRQKALDDTIIVAPFDAIVAERFVENNEHIKKQASILAVKDISEIEVVIQIPERLMAHGAINSFSDIRVNFDADTKRWFPAHIKEYSAQSNSVTRTYDVAVRLPVPTGLEILPGMTATVRTVIENKAEPGNNRYAYTVPVEAVFAGSDGTSYTWIIPETEGQPKKQPVTVGVISGNSIEVLDGLDPGSRIATAGVHTLSEKMTVRPMKEGGEGLDG